MKTKLRQAADLAEKVRRTLRLAMADPMGPMTKTNLNVAAEDCDILCLLLETLADTHQGV